MASRYVTEMFCGTVLSQDQESPLPDMLSALPLCYDYNVTVPKARQQRIHYVSCLTKNLLLHRIHDYLLFTRRLPQDRCLQCIVVSVCSANRSGGGIHKWATHFMAVQVLSRAQDGTAPRIASALLPSVRTRANQHPFHSNPLPPISPDQSARPHRYLRTRYPQTQ